ncbi:sigma-70 family RNA polymerase sigma factor [Nocardia xishanensis]|uniref:RNA polymerase sigma factor n=1 Tax=Nocardia xishanensis TaxID=238964 RepID=UPI0033E08DAB
MTTENSDDFQMFYKAEATRLVRNLRQRERVSEALAEDIAQHAMLVVYRKWTEIKPEAPARISYLYTAAKRKAVQEKKKNSPTVDIDEIPEHAGLIEDGLAEWPRYLAWLYEPLTLRQRRVVSAVHLDGNSIQEVGELLGICPNTVKNDLRKALWVLRNKVQEEGER